MKKGAILFHILKFIYSEKATKFCEISTVDLTGMHYTGQTYGGETKENYFSGIKKLLVWAKTF